MRASFAPTAKAPKGKGPRTRRKAVALAARIAEDHELDDRWEYLSYHRAR